MLTILLVLAGGTYGMAPMANYRMVPESLTYADAYTLAVKDGKRLAVFIAIPARDIPGVVSVSVSHEGHWKRWYSGTITVYREGNLELIGNVVATVSDAEIRNGGKVVQPLAASVPRIQSATDCVT